MSEVQGLSMLERWTGGFPGEHHLSTLESLESSDDSLILFFEAAKKVVDYWQGNQFAGIYLYGAPGTGKTHAAIGLGRALHERGAEIHYRFGPEVERDKGLKSVDNWMGERNDPLRPTFSVFPYIFRKNDYFTGDTKRNPKTALIFDDYRPQSQPQLLAAIEAAAHYGGFVIVTSNYEDPFILTDSRTDKANDRTSLEDYAIAPSLSERHTDPTASASLRSRIAAGFRFIQFSGEDRRQQQSFWNT